MKNLIILSVLVFLCQCISAQSNEQNSSITCAVINEDGNRSVVWTTTKEVNSSYFLVERSVDGKNYATIGRVKATGYSLLTKNYSLEEADSQTDNYYYRVILVNMEGERDCSLAVSEVKAGQNELLSSK